MVVLQAWCIDFVYNDKIVPLDKLEVCEYETYDLWREMQIENCKRVEDLTDYDRCVFSSEEEAEIFLSSYKDIYKKLKPYNYCLDKNLPAVSYKKHMLIQTIMGYKKQTYRNYYRKNIQPGDLFNLHDRTHFVTVRLHRIIQVGVDNFKYEFCKVGANESLISKAI